eukprot:m.33633 g.33633  ORF g.33633 m.33633 type:complete len:226 (+) comp9875_c2_seq1:2161-2838(+)
MLHILQSDMVGSIGATHMKEAWNTCSHMLELLLCMEAFEMFSHRDKTSPVNGDKCRILHCDIFSHNGGAHKNTYGHRLYHKSMTMFHMAQWFYSSCTHTPVRVCDDMVHTVPCGKGRNNGDDHMKEVCCTSCHMLWLFHHISLLEVSAHNNMLHSEAIVGKAGTAQGDKEAYTCENNLYEALNTHYHTSVVPAMDQIQDPLLSHKNSNRLWAHLVCRTPFDTLGF